MCKRCATSARDSPWRARSAARVWPAVLRGAALSALSSMSTTWDLLGLFEKLLRFRQVGEAAPQLLQVTLLGGRVVVGARDLHAEHERLEVRLRREAHVA